MNLDSFTDELIKIAGLGKNLLMGGAAIAGAGGAGYYATQKYKKQMDNYLNEAGSAVSPELQAKWRGMSIVQRGDMMANSIHALKQQGKELSDENVARIVLKSL